MMSKVFNVILALSLLATIQSHAASPFKRILGYVPLALSTVASAGIYKNITDSHNDEMHKFIMQAKEQGIKRKEEHQKIIQEYAVLHNANMIKTPRAKTPFERQIELQDMCRKNNVSVEEVLSIESDQLKEQAGIGSSIDRSTTLLAVGQAYGLTGKETIDPYLKEFIIGHECAHQRLFHQQKKHLNKAGIPISATSVGLLCRAMGGGRIMASSTALFAGIGLGLSIPFLHKQYEHEADKNASKNPYILETGASLLETLTPLYQQEISLLQLETHKKYPFINFYTACKIAHFLITHPHPKERARQLREQAAKLRAEQETNK